MSGTRDGQVPGARPARWPVVLALAFSLYSGLLLWYATDAARRVRESGEQHVLADSQRRAQSLGDRVADIRTTVRGYAEAIEIHHYLVNRDLGLSPRYGLDYFRDIVLQRFEQRAAGDGARWHTETPRVGWRREDGRLLVETTVGVAGRSAALPVEAAPFLTVDPASGLLVVAEGVRFKDQPEGFVVAEIPLAALTSQLLESSEAGGTAELLLGASGAWQVGADGGRREDWRWILVEAARVEPGRLAMLRSPKGTAFAALRSPVPGLPADLLTLLPAERLGGPSVSFPLLGVAIAVPVFLLFAALRLSAMQEREVALRSAMVRSEQERASAESRNARLVEEIGRRERAEHALAASEQRWQLAIDGGNDGVWDWHIATGEVYHSPRWKAMLGYPESARFDTKEAWVELIHPDDRAPALQAADRHLAGETGNFECEMRLRCRDGTYKWILSRAKALFDEAGRPQRMTGSHSDISKRRAAETALAERTDQLGAIFEMSMDGFVSFGPDGRARYANAAFWSISRLDPAAFADRPFAEFVERLAAHLVPDAGTGELRRLAATGSAGRIRCTFAGPGRPIVDITIRQDSRGPVTRMLHLRDVSRESEVDRLKSEFLATAAHELRTPLSSIFGYAELLLGAQLEPAVARESLEAVYRNASLVVAIVNELLDLARIEARGGKDFRPETLDLRAVAWQAIEDFLVPAGRQLPVLAAGEAPLSVRADPAKLAQAIGNVLSNAYKYSPDGGEVRLDLVGGVAGGRYGVRVSDHGIGIAAEHLSRVCERFFRVDTSGRVPGTGLGMAIVREIVDLHGGQVALESRLGEGTTVTLWLPTADSSGRMPALNRIPAPSPV